MNDLYARTLSQLAQTKHDITVREMQNGSEKIAILFVSQLVNRQMISEEVIKPIGINVRQTGQVSMDDLLGYVLSSCDLGTQNREDQMVEQILRGFCAILLSDDDRYLIVNVANVPKRSITPPELGFTLRGPRDSFNENLDDNLALIRYRIKDPGLVIDTLNVGRRTKTRVSILHISDIANDQAVREVSERIKQIDVDGIVESGMLQRLLLPKALHLFPQMGITERSDMAGAALLEGKVVVLVEGSLQALFAPKVFSEFFFTCDDHYDNKFFMMFSQYIRMTAAILSVSFTALYIAILSFHIDTLPADFILIINQSSQGTPFNVFVGAVIAEMIVELIREALVRIPKQIGSGVAVVGGIVIGQAAIAAKIFSPLLLIVVSISLLASFTPPDYTIANPLRIIKLFLMLLSASFGLIGFTLGVCIVTVNVVSISSFGTPYFAPMAPFIWYDFKHTFLSSQFMAPYRSKYMKTKDDTRE